MRAMRRALWGLMAAGLLLAGCGSASSAASAKPSGHTLTGGLTLNDEDTAQNICTGTGGYSDIASGASVTVENQSGTIIGTGTLGPGRVGPGFANCVYTFVVPGLPDESFYQVEVTHRGFVSYSRADIVANKWIVEMTLGSNS